MMTIVLLPGMDGSGSLFSDFIASLPAGAKSVVVTYPPDLALGYSELEALVRVALPTTSPYFLIGESFSGPIAIALAASRPNGLCGVVLVCSFAQNPIAMPSWLRPLVSLIPVWLIPTRIAAALLLGQSASSAIRARLSSEIARVKPAVWRSRLKAVLSVDVAVRLREISVPVLYLRAKYDRVVPRSASELIARFLPGLKVIELDGPHFMLQAKPAESAAQLLAFAREVGFAL
jgi:pimeloyl-[acyl-carrier protein] methyl ester esterase